jgi:hypothetical protein
MPRSGVPSDPQASPHFFRRDFNKLEIGQSVGRSIVVAPRGWPSFSFPRFRAGGNERRVNIRLLQMLMVHVGVKNEGIREVDDNTLLFATRPSLPAMTKSGIYGSGSIRKTA